MATPTVNTSTGHYRQAIDKGWLPNYARYSPWRMGIMVWPQPGPTGARPARTGNESGMLETRHDRRHDAEYEYHGKMYSDYVLPIADHYEREDIVMEGRTPYRAGHRRGRPAPLGESLDGLGCHLL